MNNLIPFQADIVDSTIKTIDWILKGERQEAGVSPPFQPGEYVRVNGFFEQQGDAYRIHVDADGRVADNFLLTNDVDYDRLAKFDGIPLESVVRVLSEKEESGRISNVFNYYAELIGILSLPMINPTPEQIAAEPDNRKALIMGRFAGYEPSGVTRFLQSQGFPKGSQLGSQYLSSEKGNSVAILTVNTPDGDSVEIKVNNPPRDFSDRKTVGLVKTQDGRTMRVNMPTGRTVFRNGSQENLYGKDMEEGDVVRISTRIGENGFFAHWCDPSFLETPSQARLESYDSLRQIVADNISEIDQALVEGDYSRARQLIGSTRELEITRDEFDQIEGTIYRIPDEERPITNTRDCFYSTKTPNNYFKDIDKAYGIVVESMTTQEFMDFAKAALAGDIPEKGKHCDVTYFWRLAEGCGMSEDVQEELIRAGIDGRLARIEGVEKPEFQHKYLIETGLGYLLYLGTESALQGIRDYAQRLEGNDKVSISHHVRSQLEQK
ncbi:MAG: hypothetical protein V1740_05175 [Candidatus Woesearchaeota archaeon]